MRNIFTAFSLIFIAFLFAACSDDGTSPNELGINARDLLPLKVGNYWIYESVKYDSSGIIPAETNIDSFVVSQKVNIEGIDGYEIKIFRDGKYFENGFYRTEGSTILTCNKVFHPLLYNDSADCYSMFHFTWKKLFYASNDVWSINEISDSVIHEALVYNSGSKNTELVRFATIFELFLEAKLTILNDIKFNSKKVFAYKSTFTGDRKLLLIEPPDVALIPSDKYKCVYFNNNRGMVAENIEFQIIFGENIGIMKTIENIQNCKLFVYRRERSLLRYKLL